MTFQIGPIHLPDPNATAEFASRLALLLEAGDIVLLEGDLGAGKSDVARTIIRTRLNAPHEEVPSPTFTLVQTYPMTDGSEIWHCDLYRLSGPNDAIEIGLLDAFGQELCLVEWPNRLGEAVPKDALKLTLRVLDAGRDVTLEGSVTWARRLEGRLG